MSQLSIKNAQLVTDIQNYPTRNKNNFNIKYKECNIKNVQYKKKDPRSKKKKCIYLRR